MGAFGNTLQAYFGGTKHDVSTWKSTPTLSKKQLQDKLNEEESERLEYMISSAKRLKETYDELKKNLANSNSEDFFKTPKYQKEFDKWKKEFIKTL